MFDILSDLTHSENRQWESTRQPPARLSQLLFSSPLRQRREGFFVVLLSQVRRLPSPNAQVRNANNKVRRSARLSVLFWENRVVESNNTKRALVRSFALSPLPQVLKLSRAHCYLAATYTHTRLRVEASLTYYSTLHIGEVFSVHLMGAKIAPKKLSCLPSCASIILPI